MRSIKLFMFPYQVSYRVTLQIIAEQVFEAIESADMPTVLMVGARARHATSVHPVCIEPEDDEWSVEPFDNLLPEIEETISTHPLQNLIFDHEPSMREKPEKIRRLSVSAAIRKALVADDLLNNRRSFCGIAVLVDQYYVVPVIQLPESLFEQFKPLTQPEADDYEYRPEALSLVHACVSEILSEAVKELQVAEPGRDTISLSRKPSDMVRNAVSNFMHTPAYMISKRYVPGNLTDTFNMISSLMYEGLRGIGHLILANPESKQIDFAVRFKKPIPFHEPRWARKILQMASSEASLIADSEMIYGLGKLNNSMSDDLAPVFVVDFLDHYHWELRYGSQTLLKNRYGEATLPQDRINIKRFRSNFIRLFPDAMVESADLLCSLFADATKQKHGSMIVVATDAEVEAQRLHLQGTVVQPTILNSELFLMASAIDGTILIDQNCICYAVGVILDGMATTACTPSRGSRFNSGVRYVGAGNNSTRLVIVVSDDRTVDVFPMLRSQVSSVLIEEMIKQLELSSTDNYHKPRNWLEKNRFYLTEDQCGRINCVLGKHYASQRDSQGIIYRVASFEVNPEMNEGYLF